MAKRFNIYQSFANFLTERNNVSNELAVVNTDANNFSKSGLFCKGRLISKPQIPFAGVIENVYQEENVNVTTITNSNLYFLQDKNCFGIGDITYATDNTDKLSFKFQGQYLFNINQVINATAYGLKYVETATSGKFKLIPNEDFEYYIYNRPGLIYKIVGNPDNQFCKLHTDYQLKSGDYILRDGTILPVEYYNSNFTSALLSIIVDTKYRSFIPYPINSAALPFMNAPFSPVYMNNFALSIANEPNGKNIRDSIYKIATAYAYIDITAINGLFPLISAAYGQSLCKMYIPTFYEIRDILNNTNLKNSINKINGNTLFDTLFNGIVTSTFMISTNSNPNFDNIVIYANKIFRPVSSILSNRAILFGNY